MAALIFHLSREYLTQEHLEQFMELGAAFGVDDIVLVTRHQEVAAKARNIRKRQLGFAVAPDLPEALRLVDGVPIYLSEQGEPLASAAWPGDPVFIVGDDRREIPDQIPAGAMSVSIPVKRSSNLWSQQAAAIVLHQWFSTR